MLAPNDGFMLSLKFEVERTSVVVRSMSFCIKDDQIVDLLEACKITHKSHGREGDVLRLEPYSPADIVAEMAQRKPQYMSVYSMELNRKDGWQKVQDWCKTCGIAFAVAAPAD